jgi:ATP/ADP translocase
LELEADTEHNECEALSHVSVIIIIIIVIIIIIITTRLTDKKNIDKPHKRRKRKVEVK